jgi:putative component of toxin-antitoxin plasmid stabilization module
MVDFTVGDAEGRKALTGLVLTKRDGSPAFGMNVWNAMLGLIGVTDAKIVQDNVFALNGSHKPGYRIHAVEKKRIGMLLQYVEDKDENGFQVLNDKGYPIYHMVIQCLFDPATNRTFSEIVEGKEALTLPKLIAKYKDDLAKVAEDSAASEPAQKPEGIVDDMPF